MTDRQFLWGLSGGISVFAVAGAFWFGLGVSSVLTPGTHWMVWTLSTVIQVGACAGLLWAGARLRRRSRFRTTEFRDGDERHRAESRRIRVGFGWTTAGQTVLIALGVWWCVSTNAVALIWPWIGLIVSLHLIPLANIFHVREYYVTAFAGAGVSLVGFTGLLSPYQLAALGGGLAADMWFSATYLVLRADMITTTAVRKPWAV